MKGITELSGHFVTFVLYGHSVPEKMESHNSVCLYTIVGISHWEKLPNLTWISQTEQHFWH